VLFCSPKTEKIITIALPSEPNTLDPLFATDLMSRKLNRVLFQKLFQKGKEGKLENDLAKSFSIKNSTLTIELKEGILNSQDVVYSLERAKQEDHPTKSQYTILEKILVESASKLKIQFKGEPNSILELLSSTGSSIYKSKSNQDSSFVSSGKYKLENWVRNNYIDLQLQSLEYKNRLPSKVRLRFLQNTASAIYLFNRGQVDILKIPYYMSSHPTVEKENLKFIKGKSIQYIAINLTEECFDSHFRKSLNYSIDRKKIISTIFDSYAQEIYESFPEQYIPKNINLSNYKYDYNLSLAKEELKLSKCYPQILEREIDFRMRADDENKAKGPAIAQYLKSLGLKVKLKPMEKAPLYKENSQKKGDLTLLTWYIDYDSALNFIDPLFSSDSFGNGGNRAFFQNKEMDQIILKSRNNLYLSNIDQERAMQILRQENPWIFLWSLHENYLLPNKTDTSVEWDILLF
jgi:peptide/nickel transport system substrate-binding protein